MAVVPWQSDGGSVSPSGWGAPSTPLLSPPTHTGTSPGFWHEWSGKWARFHESTLRGPSGDAALELMVTLSSSSRGLSCEGERGPHSGCREPGLFLEGGPLPSKEGKALEVPGGPGSASACVGRARERPSRSLHPARSSAVRAGEPLAGAA